MAARASAPDTDWLACEWAAEFLPDGVRVNAIAVAEVMAPPYRRWLDTLSDPEGKLTTITRNIPLGQRMTTAREIADSCTILLSDRASHGCSRMAAIRIWTAPWAGRAGAGACRAARRALAGPRGGRIRKFGRLYS